MKLNFYSSFEEKFRGSRSTVKSRLEVYIPFIKPLLSIYPAATAIDLGCGRGEWLELLNDHGFSACGVDLNEDMLEPAKKMGLTVHCDEAISFLKKIPDASQVVVSAFHIVEHIPFSHVEILIQEALRALLPGGILIVETPNPENIVVGTANFYLDPTHRHPIPPQLLAFLPEYYGFSKIKLLRLQEYSKLIDNSPLSLLDVLRGVSPDCAIVAQKMAEEAILNLNDKAFAVDYGITLEQLASTYEAQNARKLENFGWIACSDDKTDDSQTASKDLYDKALAIMKESESNRTELLRQMSVLSSALKESELDRLARAKQIDVLTILLKESAAKLTESRLEWPQLRLLRMIFRKIKKKTNKWKEFTLFDNHSFIKKMGIKGARSESYKETVMTKTLRRIVVDLTPILPGGENGGAKIFVLELIKQLAQLAPKTEFTLLTQTASHNELKAMERKNIHCLMAMGNSIKTNSWFGVLTSTLKKFPYLGRKLGAIGYRIYSLLKRRQAHSLLSSINADLLFCPFTAPTYFEPGIPTVCTIYDLQYKTYPEFFNEQDLIHRNHIFIEACRRASMLAAISEYSRQSAMKHGGIRPEKIHTIHLQMARRILANAEQDKSILNRLGLASEEYLLYPANFWKHKNHEMLITAFGVACQEKLPVNIKLVCSGAENDRVSWLRSAVVTMNLGDRVLFPGYLTNDELAVLMANSKGVIFPSLYEGFGLPIIEAMAAGIPVACSNLTSLPEIAANAALAFNPRIPTQIADAIVALCTDDDLRQTLIHAGKERAELFSHSSHMAQEYWSLFQHAVQNNKQEDALAGIYEDGWAGAKMSIQIAPSTSPQTLEMEFFVPDWLPLAKVQVKTIREGKTEGQAFEVLRGKKAALVLALPTVGGHYEVRMTPTFIPTKTGHSDSDVRELSLMIQRCSIKRNNDESIELISRTKSA